MTRESKQFGLVSLHRSELTGLWIYIEDSEGNCLCEVDCGIGEAQTHLLCDDITKAFEWATEVNKYKIKCELDDSPVHDEIAEWNHAYLESVRVE